MIHAGLLPLISAGGDQDGLSCIRTMDVVPCHCLPARPTPTVYRSALPLPVTK
jgi:hypothetical protein